MPRGRRRAARCAWAAATRGSVRVRTAPQRSTPKATRFPCTTWKSKRAPSTGTPFTACRKVTSQSASEARPEAARSSWSCSDQSPSTIRFSARKARAFASSAASGSASVPSSQGIPAPSASVGRPERWSSVTVQPPWRASNCSQPWRSASAAGSSASGTARTASTSPGDSSALPSKRFASLRGTSARTGGAASTAAQRRLRAGANQRFIGRPSSPRRESAGMGSIRYTGRNKGSQGIKDS